MWLNASVWSNTRETTRGLIFYWARTYNIAAKAETNIYQASFRFESKSLNLFQHIAYLFSTPNVTMLRRTGRVVSVLIMKYHPCAMMLNGGWTQNECRVKKLMWLLRQKLSRKIHWRIKNTLNGQSVWADDLYDESGPVLISDNADKLSFSSTVCLCVSK